MLGALRPSADSKSPKSPTCYDSLVLTSAMRACTSVKPSLDSTMLGLSS